MIMPVDAHVAKREYYLKLCGNARVQDWRWRFMADTDEDAIAMSVEQLGVVGDSRWVSGAHLIRLVPEGEVKVPTLVYAFSVAQSVKITEEGK